VTELGNNLSGAALKFLACLDPASLISISDGRSATVNFVAGWFVTGVPYRFRTRLAAQLLQMVSPDIFSDIPT
jgi:hypothetical protein